MDETIDLSRLDAEVTTYINYGDPPVVPGQEASVTVAIPTADATVPIPRPVYRSNPVPSRPSDGMLALLSLAALLAVTTVVALLVVVIH